MTPKAYIQSELDRLRQPAELSKPENQDELAETIYRLIASKKFRKYSLTEAYSAHIKNSISQNVQAGKPINLTFVGGCYKLWRLNEAPEADWAELFSYIYFTQWVKPVCAVYKPGVWFDFLLDDLIVSRLNNIPESDVEACRASRQRVLAFLKPYQPANLGMTLTSKSGLFPSRQAYEEALEQSINELSASLPCGLPKLSEAAAASITLNVKATPEQLADPKWREKVELVHNACYMARNAPGYYAPSTNKIIAFTQPFSSGTCIAVGSTKDSIVKPWVGVGALKPRDDSFRKVILSPSQLKAAAFDWAEVGFEGLEGKNFKRIRVLKSN